MKKYIYSLSLLAISFSSILTLQAQLQLDKWKITEKAQAIRYSPTNGDYLFFIVFIPENIHQTQKKNWLLKMANKVGKTYDTTPIWKTREEKNNEWSSSTRTKWKGKDTYVALKTESLTSGNSFIVTMAGDQKLILKYYRSYANIINDAKKRFSNSSFLAKQTLKHQQKKKTTTKKKSYKTKQERLEIARAIRTTLGKGVKSTAIHAVWVHSWFNVVWGGISVNTYLLLKDGSVYDGLEIPPNELLIHQSKTLEPEKWTKWKKSGNGYQIFNKKKGTWKKLEGKRAIKTKTNEKLNAKYITANGSQMTGSHKSWITFKPNGKFELKNLSIMGSSSNDIGPSTTSVHKSDKTGTSGTTVVVGTSVGGGTSSKKKDGAKNMGTYTLNEYTITLNHDNGDTHTELFYFFKTNRETFIYKDDRFWVDTKKD